MSAKDKWPEWKHAGKRYAVEKNAAVAEFIPFDEMPESFDRAEGRAKRVVELWNATLDMSDPVEQIQSMRAVIKELLQESCYNYHPDHDGECKERYAAKTELYCAHCLARHTLKGKP